jgi:hypothetical protein
MNAPPGLFILQPTREQISAETALSFERNMDGIPHTMLRVTGRPVDEARNELAASVLARAQPNTLCLWIDDDCYWGSGTISVMLQTFMSRDFDVLCAYFGPRAPFSTPLCLLRPNDIASAPREGRDFSLGQVIPIASASMNFVLHRAALLERLGPAPFTPHEGSLGEDHSFFERVRASGARAALASGIVVAHCEDGLAFVPGRRPFEVVDNKLRPALTDLSDAEIAAKYANRNVRRSYGPAVDAL